TLMYHSSLPQNIAFSYIFLIQYCLHHHLQVCELDLIFNFHKCLVCVCSGKFNVTRKVLTCSVTTICFIASSLAAYGAYVHPMPYSNEVGLRMLTGGAAREAAVLGYHITPLFSYYAYHGPVFRVLLRLNRGKIHDSIMPIFQSSNTAKNPVIKLGRAFLGV
ncbi:hypothetical protein S245_067319, partial [Arachis hypogaea]